VRYIKLGEGGEWEKECLEDTHSLRIGFRDTNHGLCLAKKWQAIREGFLRWGHDPRTATRFTNEVKEFYEGDKKVLWITFYKRFLWWCFSQLLITRLPDKRKTRPAIGGWKCTNIDGKTLDFAHLSQKLLRLRLFKGTICTVREPEYVLSRINGRDRLRRTTIPEEVMASEKYIEGAVRTIPVNAYERNRKARRKCIEHHGWMCAACGFKMADLYGKLGEELIHVHHLRELSSLGKEYEVDPINDLSPVCPNCHAILHTASPAMSIERLRRVLATRKPIQWPIQSRMAAEGER
jgi:hypothetical protein